MKNLPIVGKYIYIIALLAISWAHFSFPIYMLKSVPLPGASTIVMVVGVLYILVALSLIIGKFDKLALIILGVVLLLIAFISHFPRLYIVDNDHAYLLRFMDFIKVFMLAGATFAMTSFAKDSRLTGSK